MSASKHCERERPVMLASSRELYSSSVFQCPKLCGQDPAKSKAWVVAVQFPRSPIGIRHEAHEGARGAERPAEASLGMMELDSARERSCAPRRNEKTHSPSHG